MAGCGRQDLYHSIRELALASLVEIVTERNVRLADRGRAFLDDIFHLRSSVEQLWRRAASPPRPAPLFKRIRAAVRAAGGVATRHMLPTAGLAHTVTAAHR